ncbi:MAG TPA: crosslink repair DNA glycosylase YcaQ family protein, partial [Candidatus Binataceae bacterium]|nr:crosslink repair DNA glycosylase YcaQ family protein [Candidatus Binataceae bacterium]
AARLVGEQRTTLIFTLSRRWAERVAINLQKRVGADAVMAHHGSLARQERLEAEQRLKRGELKAIVATASLELGIDVGAVDLVCQIDSPRSISAAIQRIGRSGHSLGGTPKGRFFALTLDDLIESAACVRAIRGGHLDEVEIPTGCLDIVAQQVAAIAADEEEISINELLAVIHGAYNFSAVSADVIRKLLLQLSTQTNERIRGATPRIHFDSRAGIVRTRRGARMAAIMSGGTIPESGNYDVVIESQGRKIGDVEEDFAQESSRGDVFTLGSMPWQIQRISRGRLMVEPAPGMAPSLPFWQTEAAGRSWALSREVMDIRREIARRIQSDGDAAAAVWLHHECFVDESAAAQAVAYVRRGVAALGAIPDEGTVVVERFFDGLGGTQIVIHTPYGIRFNRGLGLAIRKRLCQSFDFEIQASAIDDGCLLALNARHSFPLEDIVRMVPARAARGVLVQALLNAPMFEVRFRHVATRALSIMRSDKGARIPAYLQRLRSQELLAALFPGQQACFENRPPTVEVPDHFILEETIRECLEESTDAAKMESVLGALQRSDIRVRAVDSIAPSVFAHRLLLAWDYSFLDGGERANRRSRTVQMNHAMAEDVLRSEDLSEMLSRDAIEEVVADAQARAANRRARNPEEVLELIRNHGALDENEIGERTRGDAGAMLASLIQAKRIIRACRAPGAPEMFIAAEDADIFVAAYPDVAIDDSARSAAAEIDPDDAREELLRRAMRTSGPVTPAEIASRLGFASEAASRALTRLEAGGSVFRGHFTSASTEQWCDRYILERIHRATLARVRAEIEPVEDADYAAFLARWHHIGGADLEPGAAGVAIVLEQLAGLPFTPEVWERAILPARVLGYRAEFLDLLCMSGQFAWAAVPGEIEGDPMPSRVALIERGDEFLVTNTDSREPTEGKEVAVWKGLREGGAQYLDQIADRADLSERDVLAAIWRLAARGLVSNDSFAPLRIFSTDADRGRGARLVRASERLAAKRDLAMRARLKSSVAGRWSAIVERSRPDGDGVDRMRELAMRLLKRHGILAREMLALESIEISWGEIAPVLRRMEYAGTIRRGWFVKSLSGEQYALAGAVDMLRATRDANRACDAPIALSAVDPANPYGAILRGRGVARETSNIVVLRGGRLVLGLAGRAMTTFDCADDGAFSAAVGAILALRGRLVIETIDDCPALESERVTTLAAMRFHSDGRALVYDGLPGPIPMRANRVSVRR